MANDFSGDSHCKALWRFENGALTTDSKGSNTLTASGSAPTSDTGNYMEGAGCADFELSSSQYYYRSDANLSAGFPLKSGDSNKKISVCFFFRAESLSGSAQYIWAKYNPVTNGRSLGIIVGTTGQIGFNLGYNSGNSYDSYIPGSAITVNKWYHVGITYDDSDRSYRIKVYNVTDGVEHENNTGTAANNIYVSSQPLYIAARSDATVPIDGKIDELVVFDDVLTDQEIDDIRDGVYGASGGTNTNITPPKGTAAFSGIAPTLTSGGGKQWVVEVDGADIVAGSISAGKIAAGAIGADAIAANTILAKHLVVADFSNMLPNPSFIGGDGSNYSYGTPVGNTTDIVPKATAGVPSGAPSDYVVRLNALNDTIAITEWIDGIPGEVYAFSAMFATGAGTTATFVPYLLYWLQNDSQGGVNFTDAVFTENGQGWRFVSGQATLPASTKRFRLVLQKTSSGTAKGFYTNLRLRKAASSELIVDGAIKANHLDVDSVTAGAIEAGAIGATEIAARTIAAEHLVIGNYFNLLANGNFIATPDNTEMTAGVMPPAVASWRTYSGTITVRDRAYSGVPANCPAKKCVEMVGVANLSAFFSGAKAYADAGAVDFGIPVVEGESYHISCDIAKDASFNGTFTGYVFYHKTDGTHNNSNAVLTTAPTTSWASIKGTWVAPAGAIAMSVYMDVTGHSAGKMYCTNFRVHRMTETNLIVDGAVIAKHIAADQILASHVSIGTLAGTAMNRDPKFMDPAIWVLYGADAPVFVDLTDNSGKVGNRVVRGKTSPNSNHYGGELIPCDITKKYRISVWARKTSNFSASGTFIGLASCDEDGAFLGSGNPYTTKEFGASLTTSWQYFSDIVLPAEWNANTKFMRPFIIPGYLCTAGYVEYQDFRVEQEVEGSLLVDGTITTDKLSVVNMVATDTNYLVSVGWKIRSAYLTTREVLPTSTYFEVDGQLHVYFWNTAPATDTWTEVVNLGRVSGGYDYAHIYAESLTNQTVPIMGKSLASGGYGVLGYGANGATGIVGQTDATADAIGVHGGGNTGGYGLSGAGDKAPLLLGLTGASAPPQHTAYKGSIVVNDYGDAFINVTGGSGYGAWRTLGVATGSGIGGYAMAEGSLCRGSNGAFYYRGASAWYLVAVS